MTNIPAFKTYVDGVGSRGEAAKRLGLTVGMVDHILSGRRGLSVRIAKKVEADSNGFIRREQLLPDVYGPAPAEAANAA